MQFAKNVIQSVVGGGGATKAGDDNAAAELVLNPPAGTPKVTGCKVELVQDLIGHEERVWSVDWHPKNPHLLASCSGDRAVRLWSINAEGKWRCIGTLDGEHGRTVRQVCWSPDGEVLAAASFDATVSLWRRSSEQFEMVVDGVLDGHENEVKSVSWDTTGRCLATCSRDKSVWIWDRGMQDVDADGEGDDEAAPEYSADAEFECAAVLTGHSQDVKCVKWVPNSRVLMSCGYDDTIKVWEESPNRRDDWHCTKTLTGHTSTVWSIAFQHIADGATNPTNPLNANVLMASGSDDNTVVVWKRAKDEESDWTNWVPLTTVSGVHSRTIFSVDWLTTLPGCQCSTIFATGSGDDGFSLQQVSDSVSDPSSAQGQGLSVSTLHSEINAHNADINCVKFSPHPVASSPSSYSLASAGDDGKIKIWKVTLEVEASTTSSLSAPPAEAVAAEAE